MRTSISLLALAAALSAGCESPPKTNIDRHFGKAVNEARSRQAVDPDAASKSKPPMRGDGAAAKAAVEQYEKSFTQPAAADGVLNTGVGTGSVR